jgi:nucleoside-diphosphate-sugar epimerase
MTSCTGGSGLVGSATIPKFVAAGHQVIALARSDASEARVRELGATEVVRGDTKSLDLLEETASKSDAVIHAAFDHAIAFTSAEGPKAACEADRNAIKAMGDGLAKSGNNKTFIYTSGTLGLSSADETSTLHENPFMPRYLSEYLVRDFAEQGVRTLRVRLPPVVHNSDRIHPFISGQIEAARKSGFAAYVNDGSTVWQATHVDDVADLIVLALTKGTAGTALHAVKEDSIPTKDISEFIGKKMDLPTQSVKGEDAVAHFGFVGNVILLGKRVTADQTKEITGWQPKAGNLFDTLEKHAY